MRRLLWRHSTLHHVVSRTATIIRAILDYSRPTRRVGDHTQHIRMIDAFQGMWYQGYQTHWRQWAVWTGGTTMRRPDHEIT